MGMQSTNRGARRLGHESAHRGSRLVQLVKPLLLLFRAFKKGYTSDSSRHTHVQVDAAPAAVQVSLERSVVIICRHCRDDACAALQGGPGHHAFLSNTCDKCGFKSTLSKQGACGQHFAASLRTPAAFECVLSMPATSSWRVHAVRREVAQQRQPLHSECVTVDTLMLLHFGEQS